MAWGSTKKIRKYQAKGNPLSTMDAAFLALLGADYLIVCGRPMHPAVVRNWSLATLNGYCVRNNVYRAELTAKWIAAEQEKAEIAAEEAATLDNEFAEVGETV